MLQGLKRQKSTVFDSIKSREATISELNQVSLPPLLAHLYRFSSSLPRWASSGASIRLSLQ